MKKRQLKKNSEKSGAIATMIAPQRPSLLPPGVDWVDLGDMAEITEFDIGELGNKVRWDCIINGNHRVVAHNHIIKSKDDIKLRELRNRARDSFKQYPLRKVKRGVAH